MKIIKFNEEIKTIISDNDIFSKLLKTFECSIYYSAEKIICNVSDKMQELKVDKSVSELIIKKMETILQAEQEDVIKKIKQCYVT